ncbi:MAG: response regulator transcription factor [Pseudomonadota bacterium]
MTRVLLADDHPMIASALDMLLRGTDYEIVGRARNAAETLDFVDRHQPDILLLDVNMPGKSGIDVLRRLRRERKPYKVILLTAGMEDPQLMGAAELEPEGIVLKTSDPAHLLECMDAVRDGRRWVDPEVTARIQTVRDRAASGPSLTARERELVELVSKGLRNRDIAADLGVTEGTVKVYLHGIFDKFGVENRTELAMRAPELLGR